MAEIVAARSARGESDSAATERAASLRDLDPAAPEAHRDVPPRRLDGDVESAPEGSAEAEPAPLLLESAPDALASQPARGSDSERLSVRVEIGTIEVHTAAPPQAVATEKAPSSDSFAGFARWRSYDAWDPG